MKKIFFKLTIVLLMVAFYSCVSNDCIDPLQFAATVDKTSCKRIVEHQTNSQTWINTHGFLNHFYMNDLFTNAKNSGVSYAFISPEKH